MTLSRRPQPILLVIVLAPLSLSLGYLGYRSSDELGLSAADALYGSLQLFTLGGAIPMSGTPWQLDVARFLAPVAVVYAAVITLVALLREQAQRLLVGAFARNHVLVVGLGATGLAVAKGLRNVGCRVVALELDPNNHRVALARASGIRVVIGDGSSASQLRRMRVDRAKHVVTLTSNDSTNLEVAAAARRMVEDGGRNSSATLHVAIAHAELWKQLDQIQLADSHPGVTTQYVNLADRTAQRLVSAVAEVDRGEVVDRMLVHGDAAVTTRVVAHFVRRALLAGVRPRIDLLDSPGGDLLGRLRADEPWLEACSDIGVVRLNELQDGSARLAVVCLLDDAAAITSGLVLARRMPKAEIVVAVYRKHSERILDLAGATASRVHLVPAEIDALALELLERSSIELMARGRHDDYVARERATGSTRGSNGSLVPWQELDDSLKESNREFARSVGATISTLGATLTPLTTAACDEEMPLESQLLERLARAEHDRWMSALQRDGWAHTDGAKDPVKRHHPLLVPWEALSEKEKEKDRDAFRALPRMFARTGYALVLPYKGQS